MSRKDNIILLIEKLRTDLFILLSQYKEGENPNRFELNYQAKILIEGYRSVLDYIIILLVGSLKIHTTQRKLYFPIAWDKCTESEFRKKLKNDFPDLDKINNELFEKLVWIQGFEQDRNNLRELGKFSNQSKHDDLLEHFLSDFRVVHLIYNNNIIASIGDHIIYNLDIFRAEAVNLLDSDSKITFNLTNITLSIYGPQEINKNTVQINKFTKIIDSDNNIDIFTKPLEVANISYKDYSIIGSNFSTKCFLIGIMEEVERIKIIIFQELYK